ncbi:hypothetical protein NNJEOMEG_00377 [Fundidesulfovibrio magnetotacticus]|uniref:DUF1318 domain-containing protein n=1 Tax=Fundidesulfovibrio magnetotacticus TaxID=2730080 RepID=A0A6V8LII2_9BACT|nr:DUF1318 domain-containing protein [Fundidesulfovibrio magnetotacticus]GFK92552.1 hypothetical protein NNJEOMEG_00377 [Fundidesulfovibrio magnetotacticus]
MIAARKTYLAMVLLAALAGACATVNVNFPASEVAQSADLLVADAFATRNMVATRGPGQTLRIDSVPNPAVKSTMEAILGRQASLKPLYDEGCVGIGSDGYLSLRPGAESCAKQADLTKALVGDDNADRKALYEALAADLKVRKADVPRIGTIYAKAWRDNARPGWWVQAEDGSWSKK